MTLPVVFTANGPTGYNLTNSLRFRASAGAYLNRTPASAGNQKTWTFSAWIKRGAVGAEGTLISGGATTGRLCVFFNSSGNLVSDVGGTGTFDQSVAVYRDPSAWYHFVWQFDTTQATAANRSRMYINGVQISLTQTRTFALNTDYPINNSVLQTLGVFSNSIGTYNFDGYLTEVNFIDGQALTPSSFGSTNALTGVWQPARYTGTYGTNGFYLPFTDNSALTTSSNVGLGKDFSGNGNYWTTNNISITAGVTYDSMTDVPTLTSATTANYAVWNPLVLFPNTTYQATMSNANMLMTRSGGGQGGAVTTIGTTSGKFYAEMPVTAVGGSVTKLGVVSSNNPPSMNSGSEFDLGGTSVPASIAYRSNGARLTNGTTTNSWGSTYTTGDVIGVAFDADTGKIWFAKNGTWQASGDPAAGTNPATTIATGAPFYFSAGGESGISVSLNCGQQPFSYTPPTGFVALNTFNLPAPTINNGAAYMAATLWDGDGTTSRSISTAVNGVSFQPDFVWVKARNNAREHILEDSVRGLSYNNQLSSNSTGAESSNPSAGGVTGASSTSITLGGTGTMDNVNKSTWTYVGWQWKAGGTAVTNTAGTISSQVSANTTAGFSVVTYTGDGSSSATVGHGLGVAPSMIIVKSRSATTSWFIRHSSLTAGYQLRFTTDAQEQVSSATTAGGLGSGTSSVINFIAGSINVDNVNASAATYVAYCFAPIAGYSAFGSYTGNGSADGTFVYLGFEPRFVMIKRTDTGGTDWVLLDSSRDPTNVVDQYLAANLADAESVYANDKVDFLSNGFKQRGTASGQNGSGGTFIYMAFAENPFKNALAR